MKRIVRIAVLFACATYLARSESAVASSLTTSASAEPTCSRATLNVITHGLPQQCLRSDWTSRVPSSTVSPSAAGSVVSGTATPSTADPSLESSFVSPNASAPQTPQSSLNATSDEASLGPSFSESTSVQPVSESSTATATSVTATATEDDAESFLDAAKFLSFEDWKKQKLEDAGSAAKALARSRDKANPPQRRQRPGDGLDTLGEESEISLDFAGFGSVAQVAPAGQEQGTSGGPSPATSGDEPTASGGHKRNKDAGRTCKERFNYASFDCAASILKTNPKCKSATSVLVENKDSYMLNECSTDNKFLIVELCDAVQVDTIVLANFEFFSSMFRTFRVSVSDRYPVKMDKWRELGTFEARNTREVQAFLIENPMLWAKFLRVEFLSHYGNEFYCPLSLLRVHGTNMMEDIRRTIDSMEEGEDAEGADDEVNVQQEPSPPGPTAVLSEEVFDAKNVSEPQSQPSILPISDVEEGSECPKKTLPVPFESKDEKFEICPATDATTSADNLQDIATQRFAFTQDSASTSSSAPNTSSEPTIHTVVAETSVSVIFTSSSATSSQSQQSSASTGLESTATVLANSSASVALPLSSQNLSNATTVSAASSATSSPSTSAQSEAQNSPLSASTAPSEAVVVAAAVSSSASAASAAAAAAASSATQQPAIGTLLAVQREQAPSAHPPTQESIFKSITKRLALLEANATLSLQYIESQSALLRSAFSATNSQQLNKTSNFLDKLNATVLTELARAKADYDQLWQSTVLELHGQREESVKEREILGERIRLLAEEVVGTKRLMAAQATLLLVVLGLVIFTRNAAVPDNGSHSVDLRFLSNSVQGLIKHGRSHSSLKDGSGGARRRWNWEGVSPWASPPPTRPGTSASVEQPASSTGNLERRSSGEESSSSHRGGSSPRDKPLPPAPRSDSDDDQEHSDAVSERRDTVTQRNYRPSLNALRIDHGDGASSGSPLPPLYVDGSPVSPQIDGEVLQGAGARAAKSAPSTPGVGTAELTEFVSRDSQSSAYSNGSQGL